MMKKILSAALLSALLMTIVVSIAMADEAFLFRGIPWLTTRIDTKEALSQEGFKAWWDDKARQFQIGSRLGVISMVTTQ